MNHLNVNITEVQTRGGGERGGRGILRKRSGDESSPPVENLLLIDCKWQGILRILKSPMRGYEGFLVTQPKSVNTLPPPTSTKNNSSFYLCVLAAHFMELRTKKNSSFYLCVQPARFMELKTGFLVELALQNIHKLDSFLFLKIPHFDVIQEISVRYHL